MATEGASSSRSTGRRDHENPTWRSLKLTLTKGQQESYDMRLRNKKFAPTRYPDDEVLRASGISEPFWALVDHAGLRKLFTGMWPCYTRMNLEFLASLDLHKVNGVVNTVTFWLDNQNHEMTMDQLEEAFGVAGLNIAAVYDEATFWRELTLFDANDPVYNPQTAQAARLRNPVIRWLQKALATNTFARSNADKVPSHELYILYLALQGSSVCVAHHIMCYLHRHAKTAGGTFCGGGLITCLAEYLGVDYQRWAPIENHMDMHLSWDQAFNMGLLKIDQTGSAYMIQAANDHFPLPCPVFTYASPAYRLNLAMATPEHHRITTQYRPTLPFRARQRPAPHRPYTNERPAEMLQLPWEGEQQPDIDMEPPQEQPEHQQPQQEERPRRRRRREQGQPAQQPQQHQPMEWQAGLNALQENIQGQFGGLREYLQEESALHRRDMEFLRQDSARHQSQYDMLQHEVGGMHANLTYLTEMMQQWHAFPPPQQPPPPPQQPPTYHPFWYPQQPPYYPQPEEQQPIYTPHNGSLFQPREDDEE